MAVENDVVLIYFEDNPMAFARIESIIADHKPNWYHVKLLMLSIPLQVVTWILRDVYINGDEFTMNGKRMRLEKVVCPDDDLQDETGQPEDTQKAPEKEVKTKPEKESKVISLGDLKKKK